MANKTVEEIVEKAKSGDMSAFDLLYREYSEKLLKYVIKLGADRNDAEDIVSDSFVEAIEHIGDLKSNAFFSTWLHSIAKNKVYTMKKKEQKHTRVDFTSDDGDEQNDGLDVAAAKAAEYNGDTVMLPEDYAENEEVKQILADTINSLNSDQRDAVYLFYYKNNSIGEIAKQTGVSENTVKSRLSLARKYMERKLKKLQKNGVVLCAVPIPAILNIVVSESKLRAGASAITVTGASPFSSAAAVSSVSGKVGAVVAAGIMLGGGIGIYNILKNNNGNIHKGDIRTADSSSVRISDASSIDSRNDWHPDMIDVRDTDETESTIVIDVSSSRAEERPTNTNQGNTRTTQPTQQQGQAAQPAQQVITYYDEEYTGNTDEGREDNNNGNASGNNSSTNSEDNNEDETVQNENWVAMDVPAYGLSDNTLSKYYYNNESGKITEIKSFQIDSSQGMARIVFSTNSSTITDYGTDTMLTIGINNNFTSINPISLSTQGINNTAIYQNDILKNPTEVLTFKFSTDYEANYADEYGAYIQYYSDENEDDYSDYNGYYVQLLKIDPSKTVTLNKNSFSFYYTSYNFGNRNRQDAVYAFFEEAKEQYLKDGKGQKEYCSIDYDDTDDAYEDFRSIKEFKVQGGNKFYEVTDGILYFKKDGYRWLVWAPEKTYTHLTFPDNIIAYNAFEMKKIKVKSIDQISVGNNSWMKTDTEFLETLGLN